MPILIGERYLLEKHEKARHNLYLKEQHPIRRAEMRREWRNTKRRLWWVNMENSRADHGGKDDRKPDHAYTFK
jgi:hypothetical protein